MCNLLHRGDQKEVLRIVPVVLLDLRRRAIAGIFAARSRLDGLAGRLGREPWSMASRSIALNDSRHCER